MKTLYLMRHARASREVYGISDIDRPLLLEGVEDSHRIGERLKEMKIIVRHLVSSPAKRALETAAVIAKTFGIREESILVYDELYKPDIPAFEDCIFSLPDDWDHVMLVSQNPGISDFSDSLIEFEESMTTGSVLSISFNMERWINLYASPPMLNFYLQAKDTHK